MTFTEQPFFTTAVKNQKGVKMPIKLWVDDERAPPNGWCWVLNAEHAISLLGFANVTHVSLDHDLGDPDAATGYDVAKWIEERVHTDPNYTPPVIEIHTENSVGRKNIQAAKDSIKRARDA